MIFGKMGDEVSAHSVPILFDSGQPKVEGKSSTSSNIYLQSTLCTKCSCMLCHVVHLPRHRRWVEHDQETPPSPTNTQTPKLIPLPHWGPANSKVDYPFDH
jgi:hypothetical protein